ncbi:hypothetical protein D3C80_2013990 [compost metagenome]
MALASLRVAISEPMMPVARMATVTPSETAGGILAMPSMSATKIFEPTKTRTAASAYFR